MVKDLAYFLNNFFFTISFALNFSITLSTLSFKYPTAITLKNGNIFIIHETGISICDPTFSIIRKNVTVFSSGNKISSANYLSKVSVSQFNEGYIVSVIINKIYIFSPQGEIEYMSTSALTTNDVNIFISRDELYNDNQYYYLIGYMYQNSIYLEYYYYKPSTKSNSLHSYVYSKKDTIMIIIIILKIKD